MAKGHRRHQKPNYYTPSVRQVFQGKRDDFSIANDPILESNFGRSLSLPAAAPLQSSIWSDLQEIEDRRRYHPGRVGGFHPAASTRDPVAPTKTKLNLTSPVIGAFKAPRHVAICVRRKIRKAVLHALDKVGKGSSRPRRRNQWSNVKCSG